jgi:hypothetical protein
LRGTSRRDASITFYGYRIGQIVLRYHLYSGPYESGTSASSQESWALDALRNWATDSNDSTLRSTNSRDQITAVGSTSLSYDHNGNMTADAQGHSYAYDAWNNRIT